jgi:hypothetical protein
MGIFKNYENRQKTGLIVCLLFVQLASIAQLGVDLKKYDFRPVPIITPADDSLFAQDKIVGLYYGRIFEYRLVNNKVELWECFHIAYKVYDRETLDEVNTFYLPTVKDEDNMDCKGRCIDKDGNVEIRTKNDVEEIKEDGSKSNVLRFMSAKPESIIEFYYIVRREHIRESGSYILNRANYLKALDFTLIYPKYLKFDLISYNGLPAAIDSTETLSQRHFTFLHAENIAKVHDDPSCFYLAHIPRIEFVLAYNYSTNRMRINTINTVASNFYQNVTSLEKNERSAMKKIASQLNIEKTMPLLQKVQKIENYMKTNFGYLDINTSVLSNLALIKTNKVINSMGLLRAFYYLFTTFNIDFEYILTTDKTNKAFDKTFNGGNFLQESLIYFPQLNQYMSPDYMGLRVGYPAAVLTGQEGAFFKPVTVGKTSSFLTEIRPIPVIPMELNGDTIDITMQIHPSEMCVTANLRRILTGYNAGHIQAELVGLTQQELEEKEMSDMVDHYFGLNTESINVKNAKAFNTQMEDILVTPLLLTADLKDYYTIRTHNDSLLVTVGAFIGKQSPWEEKQERTLPVERRYTTHYYRTIRIEIPQNYTCTNLKELETAVYDADNTVKANAGFIVETKQEGNYLVIRCAEFYKKVYYPVEEAEKYGRVVQASANFNKATLVFIK